MPIAKGKKNVLPSLIKKREKKGFSNKVMGIVSMITSPVSFVTFAVKNILLPHFSCAWMAQNVFISLWAFEKKQGRLPLLQLFFLVFAATVSIDSMGGVAFELEVPQEVQTKTWKPACYGREYIDRPNVQKFIQELVTKHGFIKKDIENVISKARTSEITLELINRPGNGYLTWADYSRVLLTPARIKQGIEFLQDNKDILIRAEQEYGVPASVVTAVIGMETNYGCQLGSYPVLDCLVTLAFDYPPFSRFFQKQLKDFLAIVFQTGFSAREFRGSYIGAMGIPQFMPSCYQAFGVNYSGDGWADIWQSEDAIGSVANWLFQHGWQKNMPIAIKARTIDGDRLPPCQEGLIPIRTLQKLGLKGWVSSPTATYPLSRPSALCLDAYNEPEFWLCLQNYHVISHYNRSVLYAMAIHKLAAVIKSGYILAEQRGKHQGLETGIT